MNVKAKGQHGVKITEDLGKAQALFEMDIENMNPGTELADEDALPLFDASESAHVQVTLAQIFAALKGQLVTELEDAAHIATDAETGAIFKVLLTLGGDRTLDKPTNVLDGQKVQWWFKQGGGGPHTLTLDAAFVIPEGADEIVLSTDEGAVDVLMAEYDADADLLRVQAFMQYAP